MKKQEVLDGLEQLRTAATETRKAVKEHEESVAKAHEEYLAKRKELKDLGVKLQDAVKADFKATAELLKAESRARLAGLIGDVMTK